MAARIIAGTMVGFVVACGGGGAPPAAPTAAPLIVDAAPVIVDAAPAPDAAVVIAPTLMLPIDDVFAIAGRGVVATGRLTRGELHVGDALELVGLGPSRAVTVKGIEAFRKVLDRAVAGDNVGVLLGGVEQADVERGQVLCLPGACAAATTIVADLTMLASDAGGRSTPIADGYRPQLRAMTAVVTAVVALAPAPGTLAPGAAARVTITADRPIVVEPGLTLDLLESGRPVGHAVVVSTTP